MRDHAIPTRRLIQCVQAGAGLLLSAGLCAQDLDTDQQAFELSPFEVSATGGVGYRVTDTLAGTRVRSDLREVASAITVVSDQFLRDTGATSNQTLLQYTTGTEVSGTLGNYSSLGSVSPDDTSIRVRPQSATRVRGLVSADLTRNFFLTIIPWDSYNTSRVDIQRGPNSILFGVGSPGGIINADVDSATIGSDAGRLEFRVSSYGGRRASLNVNQTLIEDELAVRVAALHNQTEYRQRPAYERDRRVYGAVRYEPEFLRTRNVRTILAFNYERGEVDANRPRVGTPIDSITPWYLDQARELHSPTPYNDAGETYLGTVRPFLNHTGYNPFLAGNIGTIANTFEVIAANPGLNIGAARMAEMTEDRPYPWYPTSERWLNPASVGTGVGGRWTGGNSLGFAGIFPDHTSSQLSGQTPILSISPSTLGGYGIGVRRGEVIDDGNVAGLRWPSLNMRGIATFNQYATGFGTDPEAEPFRFATEGVYRTTSIQDPAIFDFFNHLLDGPNKKEWSDFRAYNASIQQIFFNNKLSFRLVYDNQRYTEGRMDTLGGAPALFLDVYTHLPMALPDTNGLLVPVENPNFGRPFVIGVPSGNAESHTEFETIRFEPYFELDVRNDLLGGREGGIAEWVAKIVGVHRFSGLYERHEQRYQDYGWNRWAMSVGTYEELSAGDSSVPAPLLGRRSMPILQYLGPQVSGNTDLNLRIPALSARQELYSAPSYFFNSRYNFDHAPDPAERWEEGMTVGLAPNQVGLASANAFQAENPANYIGWTQPGYTQMLSWDNPEERSQLYSSWNQRRQFLESYAIADQWRFLNDHAIVTAGLRKDKLRSYGHSYSEESGITGRPTSNYDGTIQWETPWPEVLQATYQSPTLKTYGIVLKSPQLVNRNLPWDMDFTVFYNYSENFLPEGSRVDIFGDNIAPPTGETREWGFTVSALQERVMVKVNFFKTSVFNQTLPRTYSGTANTDFVAWTGDEIKRGLQFSHPVLWVDRAVNNPDPTIAAQARDRLIQTDLRDFMFARLPDGTPLNGADEILAAREILVSNPDIFISAYQPRNIPEEEWTEADLRQAHQIAVLYAETYLHDLYQMENAARVMALTGYGEDFQALPSNQEERQMVESWLANQPDSFVNFPDFQYAMLGRHNPLAGKEGGIPEQDYRPNVAITGDTVSDGVEFEVFLQPTPNWNIFFNAAKVNSVRQNLAGSMSEWIEARWDVYKGPSGDLLWWNGQSYSDYGRLRFGTHAYYDYVLARAEEGNTAPEIRPWRFNLITNYNFTEGALRGVSVGGGYRWQDRNIIGYGISEDPDTGAGQYDVRKPFHGPSEDAIDFWIGYSRPLNERIDWRIQLNVRDAFNSGKLVPINTNPDGSVALWRVLEGRRWEVSTTFTF